MDVNPFTPGFGSSPLVLVGRDEILNEFRLALRYPGREAQSTMLIGERGCGKTVLLNRLQTEAAEHGWISVQEDGRGGLPDRLTARLARRITDLAQPGPRRRLTNITVAGVGAATWAPEPSPTSAGGDVRDTLETLLDCSPPTTRTRRQACWSPSTKCTRRHSMR
jgi:AAA ATPase-like protein